MIGRDDPETASDAFQMVASEAFVDWSEKSSNNYIGSYQLFPGVKKPVSWAYCEIEIRHEKGKWLAYYRIQPADPKPGNTPTLAPVEVNIEGAKFEMRPLVFTVPPEHIPATNGRFVTRMPPRNAKQRIERGLLLGSEFFVRAE